MHLQGRIVVATLLLAVLAIGTGTGLVLGYLFAGFSIGAIMFIMARKMIRRIADAGLATPRLLSRSPAATSETTNDDQPLAA